jgi:predicted nucleic acid-binding protein
MSTYILDTGILLHYVRGSVLASYVDQQYKPSLLPNYSVVSVVSIGEIYSLSYRLNWGSSKKITLKKLLDSIPVVDINHPTIINKFAEIDAYRCGKHPEKPIPQNESARSIGDNDLWIASTASVLGATLLTLDADFMIINKVFLDVIYIDQEKFKVKE